MTDVIIAAIIAATTTIAKEASEWVKRAKETQATSVHQARLDLLLKQVEDLQNADVTHGGLVRELSKNLGELAKAVQQQVEESKTRQEEISQLSMQLKDLADALEREVAEAQTREARTSRRLYCALIVAFAAFATSLFILFK